MHTDFWLERWEQNQIGFHQDDFNNHLQAFWDQLQIPAGSNIFVPLCGKSQDLLWLRAQGYGVIGGELSPIAVRDFFAENRLEPTITTHGVLQRWEADGLVIWLGDFFALSAAEVAQCAGAFDRASLIALPPAMRERYAQHLIQILPAHCRTLLITLEYDQQQMNGPPFAVYEAEVQVLYADALAVSLLFVTDVLDDSPGFRQRGLTKLEEKVYVLQEQTA
ncbi:thiopurine S-methyltransferase [Thiothrix unzii]|uniref:Thiopurine S-methyltransferase n=1 Tax=Thiothrix unzii TaxID=111769 RepID=A0A975F974_9GAMM|nr:thiopurine S-methyltransferase [Thiothrix unzii]QTR53289.1 thiopurine S-methyltransferase [Thiothrix unzii]